MNKPQPPLPASPPSTTTSPAANRPGSLSTAAQRQPHLAKYYDEAGNFDEDAYLADGLEKLPPKKKD